MNEEHTREIIVVVAYSDDEDKLKYPAIQFIIGTHRFELLEPYLIDKDQTHFSGGGNSYWSLEYKDGKMVEIVQIHGSGEDFYSSEEYTAQESDILLAEIRRIVECSRDAKEYTPATPQLKYHIEYT